MGASERLLGTSGLVLRPDAEQASVRSEQCWPVGTMEVIVGVGISNFVLMQQNALS